jgi:hypothetical protein
LKRLLFLLDTSGQQPGLAALPDVVTLSLKKAGHYVPGTDLIFAELEPRILKKKPLATASGSDKRTTYPS